MIFGTLIDIATIFYHIRNKAKKNSKNRQKWKKITHFFKFEKYTYAKEKVENNISKKDAKKVAKCVKKAQMQKKLSRNKPIFNSKWLVRLYQTNLGENYLKHMFSKSIIREFVQKI